MSLPPDMANVNAGVDTNAANADEAVSQNNAIYDRIVAALSRSSASRAATSRSSYYNVNYNPRPQVMPPHPDGERYGYTVSRSFYGEGPRHRQGRRVSDACIARGRDRDQRRQLRPGRSGSGARAGDEQSRRRRAHQRRGAGARPPHLRIVGDQEHRAQRRQRRAPVPMMRMAAAAPRRPQFDQSNVNVTVSVSVVFLAEP